jgi:hypothetical protein
MALFLYVRASFGLLAFGASTVSLANGTDEAYNDPSPGEEPFRKEYLSVI